MKKKNILFYVSPIVLFLDDEESFLESIKISNITNDFESYFFSEVEDAELFLKGHSLKKTDDGYLLMLDEGNDHETIFIHDIHKECLRLKSLYEKTFVSVMFIDYSMPYEDGLSFSRRMKDINVEKILLTGEIQAEGVIDAFNSGIIDAYISKSDRRIRDKIIEILHLKHATFLENINDQLSFVVENCDFPKDLYEDESFEQLLKETIQKNDIIFSCVYESGGSQILINQDKKMFHFNIYSSTEIENVLFESSQFEKNISDKEKDILKQYKKIVDYKHLSLDLLNSFLDSYLMEDFHKIVTKQGNIYYIVCSFLG